MRLLGSVQLPQLRTHGLPRADAPSAAPLLPPHRSFGALAVSQSRPHHSDSTRIGLLVDPGGELIQLLGSCCLRWGRLLWQSRLDTGLRQLLINPLLGLLRGGEPVGRSLFGPVMASRFCLHLLSGIFNVTSTQKVVGLLRPADLLLIDVSIRSSASDDRNESVAT